MRKIRKFKVKYVYVEPKTPEEKERQQKILDEAYNILFNSVLERKIKE